MVAFIKVPDHHKQKARKYLVRFAVWLTSYVFTITLAWLGALAFVHFSR